MFIYFFFKKIKGLALFFYILKDNKEIASFSCPQNYLPHLDWVLLGLYCFASIGFFPTARVHITFE